MDGEDIAVLSALIQDFERDLDLKLRVEQPLRFENRMALDLVTQVDPRSLLLDSPVLEDPTHPYRRPGQNAPAQEDETRRIIPLKKRWPRMKQGYRLHLIVESPDTPVAHAPATLVVNLLMNRPATRAIVIHIARAIEEVLGPQCQIHQVSPDEVYLQTLEDLQQNQPAHLTGMWFAAGLAAERELALHPGTGPLPALYADAEPWRGVDDEGDSEDVPARRVQPGGRRWGVLTLTVAVILLGWSFVQTGPVGGWLDHQVERIVDSVTAD